MMSRDLHRLRGRPGVTVVLPVFNADRFVADAVRSVRRSTYPFWKCVVVDDGSIDRTASVVRQAAEGDPRFHFIEQPNQGHIGAINAAVNEIEGELVALLDADDTFLDHKLERVVEAFARHPRAGLLAHRMYVGDERLNIVGITPMVRRLPSGDLSGRVRRTSGGDNSLGVTSGFALRREVFDLVFPADAAIARFPDELVRRIAPLAAEVVAIEEPLGIRRTHGDNQSDDSRHQVESYLGQKLNSYTLLRAEQVRVATSLGVELPSPDDDFDLLLMRALMAHLDGASDVRTARRCLLASEAFRAQHPLRRAYIRAMVQSPAPVSRRLATELLGASGLKLLLNHRWLRRLRREGAIPAHSGRSELSLGRVMRLALSNRATDTRSTASAAR